MRVLHLHPKSRSSGSEHMASSLLPLRPWWVQAMCSNPELLFFLDIFHHIDFISCIQV